MNNLLHTMLISFLLTVILEEAFVILLKFRERRMLLLIALINLLTNPPTVLAYYLLMQYTNYSPVQLTLGLELMVVLVEYFYLRHYGQNVRYPLWLAIGINVFSYGIGRIINILLI